MESLLGFEGKERGTTLFYFGLFYGCCGDNAVIIPGLTR